MHADSCSCRRAFSHICDLYYTFKLKVMPAVSQSASHGFIAIYCHKLRSKKTNFNSDELEKDAFRYVLVMCRRWLKIKVNDRRRKMLFTDGIKKW